MRFVSAAALAVLLAGCGGATSANNAAAGTATGGNTARADATQQRPIPCSVERHGMGAVINGSTDAACDNSVDPQTLGLDELIRIIPDQHPSFYYILARRLFDAGRRDEAVYWFYAGQLRYTFAWPATPISRRIRSRPCSARCRRRSGVRSTNMALAI